MKKILTLTLAAVTFAAFASVVSAQNMFYGQPYAAPAQAGQSYATRPTQIYQPVMTTASVFQSGDSGVPIPSDAGGSSSVSGPLQSIPSNGGQAITSPDLSLPVYQEDTTWNAFSPPVISDPFLQPNYGAQASPYAPYNAYQSPGIPPQGAFAYGANGAQPYRFGWQNRIDVSWMPGRAVSSGGGTTGKQEIFGVDYELAYGTPFIPGWVLNWTNQFAYRHWNGLGGANSFASDFYRFGIDFELETPQAGPYSLSLGITPSVNTDFQSDVWDDGFQLDGRGILFMQLDQYWTLGLGAMYWDRVNDRVLPWVGLIYRDDYWEWQLMYPEARISVFLGNEAYWSKWAYVRAEYHVEAYGVEVNPGGTNTQVEIEDYRLLAGLKMDGGTYNWFIEGGWVFNRSVEFANNTPGYEIGNGFIGQIGFRF